MGEVIVVTSGKGGVGKTTTAANIGTGLAAQGKKVVLNVGFSHPVEIEEIDGVSSKELKEIVKSAKKEYDIKVTAAKEAEVEVKIKGEEGKDKLTFYVHLIKSGGSWYVATSYPTWW
jgi:nitrogenase subunit NifH